MVLSLFFIFLPTFAQAGQPQLNTTAFAHCLAQEERQFNLNAIAVAHELGSGDLLLPYLAVYSGRRWKGTVGRLQALAHARWSTAWEARERQFAERLAGVQSSGALTPVAVFRAALGVCEPHDIFCAALVAHNVFRTLGRHQFAIVRGRDLNPEWFKSKSDFWLSQIPLIESALVPLRAGAGGERFGEWYHFFGILTFAIRERALHKGFSKVWLATVMGRVLNPILAGGHESPEKVQLDRDSVNVARIYLGRSAADGESLACDAAGTYVAVLGTTRL